jgi:hypothetical protein
MAKKTAEAGVNKSALIREIKAKQPSIKPSAIADILKSEHGIEVAPAYVSTILSQAKAKELSGKGQGKRGRPRKETGNNAGPDFTKLLLAKQLIHEMGGYLHAMKAISIIEQLSKPD